MALQRLLETSDDELEIALLRSTREDVPPAGSLLGAAVLIGVSDAIVGAGAAGASLSSPLSSPVALGAGAGAGAAGALSGAGRLALHASAAGASAGAGLGLIKPAAIVLLSGLAAFGGMQAALKLHDARAPLPALLHVAPHSPGVAARRAAPRGPAASSPGSPSQAPHAELGANESNLADVASGSASSEASSVRGAVDGRAATSERAAQRTARAVLAPSLAVPPPSTPLPASAEPASSSAEPTAVPVLAPPTPPMAAPATGPAAVESASLAPEIAVLDRARAALLARDPSATLAALDDYARARHSGILDPEAMQLRIRALLALGRPELAAGLARRLLAAHPENRRVEWLRALAEPGSTPLALPASE